MWGGGAEGRVIEGEVGKEKGKKGRGGGKGKGNRRRGVKGRVFKEKRGLKEG